LSAFRPARAAAKLAQASNEQYHPATRPVGLFLGGTSGIGQAMAQQLAQQTNGRAQIILLGRNQAAADQIISSFPKTPAGTPPNDESKYSFIKVDATSMAQIREVTSKLSKELDKVNFIVVSPGVLTMNGRDETSEGIDRKMACNFYARFRFIYDLAPLVQKAAESGEKTGVMSVFAAGNGSAVDLDDLGLAKGFTLRKAHDHVVTYKDAAFEEFATRYPKVSFNHIFPGIVITQAITKYTGARFILPLFSPITITADQCAQVMWWRMWSQESQWKTGAHQLSHHGEELPHSKFVTPEVKKAVWEHAIKMT
ncbi:hypothetical protein M408DRAFT_41713, partial [Serendipita vermifera MAFF 305830]